MAKAVIFDFDNTLMLLGVNWNRVKADIVRLAKAERVPIDEGQHIIFLSNLLSDTPARKDAIDGLYLKYEGECIRQRRYTAFPEMLSLVRRLKAAGYSLAIASGNHTISIMELLSESGLLDCFTAVCGRDLVKNNKPAADQVYFVLGKLGIAPEDALFVGDSVNDEAAARESGVRFFKVADHTADAERLGKLLL